MTDKPAPDATRPAADEVASLFGQLEAPENALWGTQQALLEAIEQADSPSAFAELREQQDILGEAAGDVVRQIQAQVENSSALAVFATHDGSVRALAGDAPPAAPPDPGSQPEAAP